jgi:hypothetical protein
MGHYESMSAFEDQQRAPERPEWGRKAVVQKRSCRGDLSFATANKWPAIM